MDFITDLPVSQGFDSLFVVVDCLSKATIIAPCNKTITAEETVKLYMNQVQDYHSKSYQIEDLSLHHKSCKKYGAN